MELYIQIRNGQPFEHPILGDNFRQAFPHVDVDNLPPEFSKFERIECPYEVSMFQVSTVVYQWVDGIVKDVWSVRDMTEEECGIKLQQITQDVLKSLDTYKKISQTEIDNAVSEPIKQAWIDHLAVLNAWVLVDPLNPNFPMMPFVEDGIIYTENSTGTAPNVIG